MTDNSRETLDAFSDINPLPIVFDTSILRRISVSKPSPEFRLLQRLAGAGKVELLMAEIVAREWFSQLTEPTIGAIDELAGAIRKIERQESIASTELISQLFEIGLHTPAVTTKLRADSAGWYRRQMASFGIRQIPHEDADAKAVLDDYFDGNNAFASRKSRKDFPDAFVYAATKRQFDIDSRSIFVCDDKALRNAISRQGVTTAASLQQLLEMQAIRSLHSNAAFALWWENNISSTIKGLKRLEEEEQWFTEFVTDTVSSELRGRAIHDDEIPSDDRRAIVEHAKVQNGIIYDWDDANSLGEGVLSVSITFTAVVELSFGVFRGECFNVPQWVDVSIGDFEEDHCFDASGSRLAHYTARFVLELHSEIMTLDIKDTMIEYSLEEIEFQEFVDRVSEDAI